MPRKRTASARTPLSRDRVVDAAVGLADADGLPAVSMRAVAARLGVEAMSLYNHVAGREGLLDGMVDRVFAEIELPDPATPWREAMQARAHSARAALRRHPWAVTLMDTRSHPGQATLRHHDAVLGSLRCNGFSVRMAARTMSLIDSYVYGFVLQDIGLPFSDADELEGVAAGMMQDMDLASLPYLVELMTEHALQPGYDYAAEFDHGLDLVLGALSPDEVTA